MAMPLAILALFFAVFATVEWNRHPFIGRVYLGVATAFAAGAVVHPGLTITDAIAEADGIAVLLAAARAVGFAAVMVSVATALRRFVLR
jgi:hypothetical protein